MKYYLLFFATLLTVFINSVYSQEYNTVINCSYVNYTPEEMIYVYVNLEKTDSVFANNGKFVWERNLDGISLIQFITHSEKRLQRFAIDTGKYNIEFDTVTAKFQIPGTNKMQSYSRVVIKSNPKLSIYNDYTELKNKLNKLDSIEQTDFKGLYSQKSELIINMIDKYKPQQAGRVFFMSFFNIDLLKVMPVSMLNEYYHQSDSAFKSSKFAKEKLEYINKMALSELGKPLSEIKAFTPDSNLLSVDSFQGKYVLIEFWASWCRPCRAESPLLRKLYKKFNHQNFEIVSFSLDHEYDKWIQAIENDSLNWINISDFKGWKYDNSLAYNFGILGIPHNIIIDPQGIVIDKGLRGEELERRITGLFE